jgi:glutathione S-transferase
MASEIVFYTNPMSRGRTIRWMLEEVGARYRTEVLEFGTTMKSAEYLAINPMGKVPAIRHGDAVVTESAAICAYLADAFPEANMAPPLNARADYYRWLFFAAGPLEAAAVDQALGLDIAPQVRRGWYGGRDAVLDAIERAVTQHTYIAGERFSAADVYCGTHIGMGMRFGTMEKRASFVDYWERISNRDAYRRATELDDALMPREASASSSP